MDDRVRARGRRDQRFEVADRGGDGPRGLARGRLGRRDDVEQHELAVGPSELGSQQHADRACRTGDENPLHAQPLLRASASRAAAASMLTSALRTISVNP